MKTIFLKRILPVAMCLLMVLPLFAFSSFANPSATGTPADKSIIGSTWQNWAPNGQTYHTSAWNYDSHSKYINNGTYDHSYQFWRPSDPSRPNGAGVDATQQNFGISFDDGYYIIDEIYIYSEPYSGGVPKRDENGNVVYKLNDEGQYEVDYETYLKQDGFNNIKYTIEALILGEWKTVGEGYEDDGEMINSSVSKLTIKLTHPDGLTIDKYRCSGCNAIYDTNSGCTKDGCEGVLSQLPDINTNNIRIKCSEYGAYAIRDDKYMPVTSHDWWYVPIVQEVELNGVTGYRPEFDVPMNAYLVTNAALSGMIGADSSLSMRYPGLAGDDDKSTNWKALSKGAQNIWAEFNQAYTIDNVGINVGGCPSADVGLTLTYNIKILLSGTIEDGTWQTVVSDATATTVSEASEYIIHELSAPTTALGMMVEITSVKDSNGKSGRAVMTELWAELSEGKKCIFLADYMTTARKTSTATGNLACYGEAYASSNFSYASISKVSNIIDGNVGYVDDAWIAETYVLGTYVGVKLREAHDVTKVALYFNDVLGGADGKYVFNIEVQAKVNGEFVTVKKATSYDAEKKSYVVSLLLDEAVYTDDVRVVFVSDAQTFPYLKEFEVFEGDFIYSSYVGYELDTSRTAGGPVATTEFGNRTVAVRGKYFDQQSPIEYFNIALEHEVDIDWLG